ncbi:sugar phosphate permease [Streptomyces sp. PanSC19]|uniref:MFS transporter n=1 Tax=Streptomyces sp. PanSC19 TaxID=1520455 RepID=UPI000F9DCFA8|nr:MFS transporter [Streptomyces sp. PanSC19]ROQ35178.1 sugar phosphate permease [Streptomyces sp. PanSC19]
MPAPPLPPSPAAPPARRGTVRLTVALLFAAWLVDYADRLVINLVLPSLGAEFDLDRTRQGLVVSAFFLAYALCQIPGGLLADRFGGRRVTLWALLSWSVFTALTGFAWSFAVLLALRFAFGAAEGVFPPASMKVLVERTTPEERGSANGTVMSSNALAAVVTPLAVAPLVAAFGWRSAFWSTAALGVLVLVAVRLRLPAPLPRTEGAGTPRPALRAILRKGVLWRFALMMFGYNTIVWGLNTWVPSYLSEEHGVSLTEAGALVAVPALGAAVATVLGGRLSDRLGGRHRLIVVPGMTVAAVALLLMANAPSLTGFVVLGTVAVFAASLAYMPIFAVPLAGLAPGYVGVGSAVVILGGQVAGMVAPPVMGALADAFSFHVAFGFLVLGAVIAAVMACLTPQDADAFRAAADRAPRPSRTTKESLA